MAGGCDRGGIIHSDWVPSIDPARLFQVLFCVLWCKNQGCVQLDGIAILTSQHQNCAKFGVSSWLIQNPVKTQGKFGKSRVEMQPGFSSEIVCVSVRTQIKGHPRGVFPYNYGQQFDYHNHGMCIPTQGPYQVHTHAHILKVFPKYHRISVTLLPDDWDHLCVSHTHTHTHINDIRAPAWAHAARGCGGKARLDYMNAYKRKHRYDLLCHLIWVAGGFMSRHGGTRHIRDPPLALLCFCLPIISFCLCILTLIATSVCYYAIISL